LLRQKGASLGHAKPRLEVPIGPLGNPLQILIQSFFDDMKIWVGLANCDVFHKQCLHIISGKSEVNRLNRHGNRTLPSGTPTWTILNLDWVSLKMQAETSHGGRSTATSLSCDEERS
jgi:hypothetical protein